MQDDDDIDLQVQVEASPEPEDTDTDTDVDSGPKSMQEAIEQGLKEQFGEPQDKTEETEQKPEPEKPAKKAKAGEKPEDKAAEEVEIPEDIKNPKSRERFREMATELKRLDQEKQQLTSQYDQVRQDADGFRAILQESQATPEEFVQLIDYSKKLKTGDLEGAFAIVEQQYNQLSRLLGKSSGGGDNPLYAEHEDLRQAVDELEISETWANQIAAQRNREAMGRKQPPAKQEPRQEPDQNQAVAKVQEDIRALGQQWQRSDIDYAAKHPLLMERIPQLVSEYKDYPHLWPKLLTDFYKSLSHVKSETATKSKNPAPLRPNGSGNGKREPKSVAEAINMSLDAMRA